MNKMLPVLIFSKDRACQLHLLLESLERNARDAFDISVVIKYSTEQFKDAYEKLFLRFPGIKFHIETDLLTDISEWIKRSHAKQYKQVLFLVDDQICNAQITQQDINIIVEQFKDKDTLSFSLRLDADKWKGDKGLNRYGDFIYTLIKNHDDYISWNSLTFNYYFPGCNYGYPMSLDGHVYPITYINAMMATMHFSSDSELSGTNIKTPNDFESKLNNIYSLSSYIPLISKVLSFKQAKFVNSPCNRVQNTHLNGFGNKFNYSQELLNDYYLNDEIIDYDTIDFSSADAPHTELEFKFKKYE